MTIIRRWKPLFVVDTRPYGVVSHPHPAASEWVGLGFGLAVADTLPKDAAGYKSMVSTQEENHMEQFRVKVDITSKDDPTRRLTATYEVLSTDAIAALKPFEQTAQKMRAHASDALE